MGGHVLASKNMAESIGGMFPSSAGQGAYFNQQLQMRNMKAAAVTVAAAKEPRQLPAYNYVIPKTPPTPRSRVQVPTSELSC
jgi:hypothetical protein